MKTRIRLLPLDKAIDLEWDDEAEMYIATSPDVPGLVLQGSDIEEIIEKAEIVIPALCEKVTRKGKFLLDKSG